MDGVLAALEEIISWPARHGAAAAALGLRWPAGLLLHGPPGTGKTAAVAAAAEAAGAPLVVVSAGSVFGSALGESEARLRAAFRRAETAAARSRRKLRKQMHKERREESEAAAKSFSSSSPPPPRYCGRAVLLLDDVDVLAPARSAAGAHEARVVAQLLTLLDGAGSSLHGGSSSSCSSRSEAKDDKGGEDSSASSSPPPPSCPPVVVIATTSKPGSLDPALRRAGRLDREVSTSLPNPKQREEILRRSAAAGLPLADDVDLARIAAEARGYSGADLVALAREAARAAMAEAMKKEEEGEGEGEERRRPRRRRRVTTADFSAALSLVGASVSRGVGLDSSSFSFSSTVTSWDDVGGIEEAKRALRRAVELPLRRPGACSRLGVPAARGVLLFGPPGCSKTTLASALATAAGASLHVLSAASLFSAYVGEGEAALRAAFASARAAPPAIVFLDEADAVGGGDRGGFSPSSSSSSGADSSSARMLAALLAEVDGLESGEVGAGEDEDEGGGGSKDARGGSCSSSSSGGDAGGGSGGVLLLAATNRPWALDTALLRPGRLDYHVLVPPPDAKGRGDALKVHCRRIPLEGDVDLGELGAAAPERTTGAELAAVAREAALAAAREGCERVSKRHFERALSAAGSSAGVSKREMERFEAWGRGEL